MKMSAATMPTKNAAISSMPSMKRSIPLRLRGAARSIAALISPPGMTVLASNCEVNEPRTQLHLSHRERSDRAASRVRGHAHSRDQGTLTPTLSPTGRGSPPSSRQRLLICRAVFRERRLQLLYDRIRVAAGLLHSVGPGFLQRLGHLFPVGELRVRDRVDLMPALGFQLGDAGMLEVGPWTGDLAGPLVGAVIVDHLLLRGGHLAIRALVEHEREGRDVERHFHVILGDLVDAEQRHRAPWERHRVGHTLVEDVAHLRRGRTQVWGARAAGGGVPGGGG